MFWIVNQSDQGLQHRSQLDKLQSQLHSVESKWITNEIAHDTYHRWHGELTQKIRIAKAQIDQLGKDQNEVHFLLKSELNKLFDMRHVYRSSTVLQKQELLRAVFDNRLYYQDCLYEPPT